MTNIYLSFFLSARKWLFYEQLIIRLQFWIGVNDINEEGTFVNMLNETVSYINWALNEPKKISSNRELYYECNCVAGHAAWNTLLYYAIPCSSLLHALCSQRYNFGKSSECQLKEAGSLTNHLSHLSKQTKKHITYRKLLFIEKGKNDNDLG